VDDLTPAANNWKQNVGCFLKGAGTGAVGTVAVGALAVGAVAVGAPVAAVTAGLGLVAVAGGVALGWDVKGQLAAKNWAGVSYDAGSFLGSLLAGSAIAMPVRTGITGETSGPSGLGDLLGFGKTYDPRLGPPGPRWFGTGPDPGGAGGATATSGMGVATIIKKGC
jgi:hypothetical protein